MPEIRHSVKPLVSDKDRVNSYGEYSRRNFQSYRQTCLGVLMQRFRVNLGGGKRGGSIDVTGLSNRG